eukprot:COSAG02_NODE_250_length_27076_cov_24.440618_21_plen_262_part_00
MNLNTQEEGRIFDIGCCVELQLCVPAEGSSGLSRLCRLTLWTAAARRWHRRRCGVARHAASVTAGLRLLRRSGPRSSHEMRSVCMILLLVAGVTDAKKNKDADRHLEQALMRESASYIDEAIEMGAVSRAQGRCLTTERLAAERVLCCCTGNQQEGSRWTDTAHGRCSAGQDQERGGASEAQPRRDCGVPLAVVQLVAGGHLTLFCRFHRYAVSRRWLPGPGRLGAHPQGAWPGPSRHAQRWLHWHASRMLGPGAAPHGHC